MELSEQRVVDNHNKEIFDYLIYTSMFIRNLSLQEFEEYFDFFKKMYKYKKSQSNL